MNASRFVMFGRPTCNGSSNAGGAPFMARSALLPMDLVGMGCAGALCVNRPVSRRSRQPEVCSGVLVGGRRNLKVISRLPVTAMVIATLCHNMERCRLAGGQSQPTKPVTGLLAPTVWIVLRGLSGELVRSTGQHGARMPNQGQFYRFGCCPS